MKCSQRFSTNGTSALKPVSSSFGAGCATGYPEGIVPARRSYGAERLPKQRAAARQAPRRGSLAGRPLNVFSCAEAIAAFSFCTALTFVVMFCM